VHFQILHVNTLTGSGLIKFPEIERGNCLTMVLDPIMMGYSPKAIWV
jgi:hypothetical protein